MFKLIFPFLLVFMSFPSLANGFPCRVVSVFDGDTFLCLTENKRQIYIRLNQIDAPEKSQAFGNKSKQALHRLIWNKKITVLENTKDLYGRTIGTVFFNGLNVNKAMVANGYAWAYRQYLSSSDRTEYLTLEKNARSSKLGLWTDPKPVYPSDFRRQKNR